jgi:hypothetical protein
MQLGGGSETNGPQSPTGQNNWGCLDDLIRVSYGQPPPGTLMGMPQGNLEIILLTTILNKLFFLRYSFN